MPNMRVAVGRSKPKKCFVKVSPEFSIRLMDETYSEQNAIIQEIQDKMVAYFKQRPAKLAQDGISGKPLKAADRHPPFYLANLPGCLLASFSLQEFMHPNPKKSGCENWQGIDLTAGPTIFPFVTEIWS